MEKELGKHGITMTSRDWTSQQGRLGLQGPYGGKYVEDGPKLQVFKAELKRLDKAQGSSPGGQGALGEASWGAERTTLSQAPTGWAPVVSAVEETLPSTWHRRHNWMSKEESSPSQGDTQPLCTNYDANSLTSVEHLGDKGGQANLQSIGTREGG